MYCYSQFIIFWFLFCNCSEGHFVLPYINKDLLSVTLCTYFFSLLTEIHVDDEVHLKGGSVMQAKQIDSDECIIQM